MRGPAPAGRWVVATGEASPPWADDRNPWYWIAIFFFAPEGAKGLANAAIGPALLNPYRGCLAIGRVAWLTLA